ncbi:unnamed protein product [Caenorhabditis auriculariae]|uniref:Alpha-mannosidase n=1 Tax=Caenorhabditis auriculariae TaxID=2777116 RepID=A0A8S1H3W7_9PELO|nr:unnamed protein product [Caenorhabditis auriculariae]
MEMLSIGSIGQNWCPFHSLRLVDLRHAHAYQFFVTQPYANVFFVFVISCRVHRKMYANMRTSLNRKLISFRRRFLPSTRVLLLTVMAFGLTAMVARYHRLSKEFSERHELQNLDHAINEDRIDVKKLQENEREEYRAPSCKWKDEPPEEALTHFNTFDMYKESVARQILNESSIKPERGKPKSSEKPKLRVFVLPFTHVDPGWLKTFKAYTDNTNQILDNMHTFMSKNPKMKFMWAEFVFFERWWSKQNESVRTDVRRFVTEGRLELASGSWVMTDEANAYFPVSVDNIVEGHQYLHQHFGVQPSTIWSNDPFGYSNSVPYLFSKTGIKRNVINRIHHSLKQDLQRLKGIPFNWRQYFDKSGEFDVLTQVLPYTHYDILNSCGPNAAHCCEFDFKRMTHWSCPGPKPVPITKENVAQKAATLLGELETMSKMYEAPVLLMMHGDDFRFDMIEEWHQHHDNFLPLFEEINKGDRAEISFGTFTDYFNALESYYKTEEFKPPTLSGDFFPYQCALGDYWTGYYTTRPFYKRQGRYLHYLIRSADLLVADARLRLSAEQIAAVDEKLQDSRRTLALFQHHDAITGTSKKSVMADYSELLFEATKSSQEVIQTASNKILNMDTKSISSPASASETVAQEVVNIQNGQEVSVNVYNSLPYVIEDVVTVRVSASRVVIVEKSSSQLLKAQIEPVVVKGVVDKDSYLLAFRARLSPLTFTKFILRGEKNNEHTVTASVSTVASQYEQLHAVPMLPKSFEIDQISSDDFRLKTDQLSTRHDPLTGLLKEVSSVNGGNYAVNNSFVEYLSASGGAYLMRVPPSPRPLFSSDLMRFLVRGPIQQTVHVFHENIHQKLTVKNVAGVLGAQLNMDLRVDITKKRNVEVMMRLQTDMKQTSTYSDSVGLQLLRRESYSTLAVAANYYPMPSAAVVENSRNRMTVASNVEHGMMVIDGGVEIAIDRMLNQDDGKGLGSDSDSLPTDLKPVDMRFSILFEQITPTEKKTPHYTSHTAAGHLSVQDVLYPPLVLIGKESSEMDSRAAMSSLPCDFQLLTLRQINNKERLLIMFRHPVVCSNTPVICGSDMQKPLVSYLKYLGAKTAQITNLNGLKRIGSPLSVDSFPDFEVKSFDFFTLIISP